MRKYVNESTDCGRINIVFKEMKIGLFHHEKLEIGNIDIVEINKDLHHFQIVDFYVDPQYRNSGIGKKLLTKAERYIIKKHHATLLTVVPARQLDAKVPTEHLYLIYEKLGFSFKTAHTLEKFLNH